MESYSEKSRKILTKLTAMETKLKKYLNHKCFPAYFAKVLEKWFWRNTSNCCTDNSENSKENTSVRARQRAAIYRKWISQQVFSKIYSEIFYLTILLNISWWL